MKKSLIIGLALGLTLAAGSALAQDDPYMNIGGAGIVDSSHDLSSGFNDGFEDIQSRICVYCHHPHNTTRYDDATLAGYSPLWNRKVTNKVFAAYNNGNMMGDSNGLILNGIESSDVAHQMNGVPAVASVSILCMSCHDGTTALNAFSQTGNGTGSAGGGTSGNVITSYADFGADDLTNHHPIGMIWDDVFEKDDEIAGKTKILNIPNGIAIADVLYDGKMECVTCHDVHNTQNDGAERFLWTSNDRSAFCLVCHLKADENQDAYSN